MVTAENFHIEAEGNILLPILLEHDIIEGLIETFSFSLESSSSISVTFLFNVVRRALLHSFTSVFLVQ